MEGREDPTPSSLLARMLCTDAAFVRKTMAGLRDRGWVTSARGRAGGWSLAVPLSSIALLDLYEALGAPSLFAVAPAEDAPACLMEQAANVALERALASAEQAFRDSLRGVTVADLAADFEVRLAERGLSGWVHSHDGADEV